MDRTLWGKSAEHSGTAGHYRASPGQKRQLCFRTIWNRGFWWFWWFHFPVVHEDHVFSVVWGCGSDFRDNDCCPATHFHALLVIWRWKVEDILTTGAFTAQQSSCSTCKQPPCQSNGRCWFRQSLEL